MLKLAVEANLPLIGVHSNDPINFEKVIVATVGSPIKSIPLMGTQGKPRLAMSKVESGKVYYLYEPGEVDWLWAYRRLTAIGASLIVVNPSKHPAFFDAGILTVPPKLIASYVKKLTNGIDGSVTGILSSLAGLSYKEMDEISKLAMTEHGEYSVKSIRLIRQKYFGSVHGIQQVDTDYMYYQPQKELTDWLDIQGKLLTGTAPALLKPRGLLFRGPPGTGKTMGAKYLANELGLPLYMLEVGVILSKYHGESDKNMKLCLDQICTNAPCLLLIDEVEKLFSSNEDNGVTARLLSMLLWWLQEHTATVLTVMTTNKESDIPPELFRPGRIDRTITFKMLDNIKGADFIAGLIIKMWKTIDLDFPHGGLVLLDLYPDIHKPEVGKIWRSHADIYEAVIQAARKHFLSKDNDVPF